MLKTLSVENYALIDKLQLDLSRSLNIITGETGAGKSILLGALGLLLGTRADAASVKHAGRNCIVEAIFEVGDYDLEHFFVENDLDYNPQTIIRRVISVEGKSRCYINDLPVPQSTLKELGSRLIDIHSQHQSLMLSDDGFRTGILDSVAGNGEILREYKETFGKLRLAERELAKLHGESARNRQDQEWLEYQVTELRNAVLREGEKEELESEQGELSHAEDIGHALTQGVLALGEDETGIVVRLKTLKNSISGICEYYLRGAELTQRLNSVLVELRDIERDIVTEAGRVDSDPGRLQQIDGRLALLYLLQQKHKAANIEELLEIQHDFEARQATITGYDETITALGNEIASMDKQARKLAANLTVSRKKGGMEVTAYVEKMLSELGIPAAKFVVDISKASELRSTGADNIRFLFSANKNMAPAPVEKIASGGEISRLMLSLKSLVAKSIKLPTIIFDEIDSGVSGPIADAMGNIIADMGKTIQVINITHLPQVASKGDTHFVVYKDDTGEISRTMIAKLSDGERVDEIAKMLSGSTVTEAAKMQATLLLNNS